MLGNFYAARTSGTYAFKQQMVTADASEASETTENLSMTMK
ncbi:MAG: hypothetical protein RR826_01790 [Christensenellaceae bacterium]